MGGQENEQVDGQEKKSVDGQENEQAYIKENEQPSRAQSMNIQTDVKIVGWKNQLANERMDERTDREKEKE